jgi:type III secretion system YscD/HrpQ family protein
LGQKATREIMIGYLIAEEGPLSGTSIIFEEDKTNWTIGRDPDEVDIVLEDPMVSRKHAEVKLTSEGYILENFSSINPVTQNGKVVAEPILLKEDDIIQIGSTFFRFTLKAPAATLEEEQNQDLSFGLEPLEKQDLDVLPQNSGWLIKVISGPNSGAEFELKNSSTYTLGKDPSSCDIVFSDMSVSRTHAKLELDESGHLTIEDLGSKNGVLINGVKIQDKTEVATQDVIAIGTTSFVAINQALANETIVSFAPEKEEKKEEVKPQEVVKKDWKSIRIPKRHLVAMLALSVLFFSGVGSIISLFNPKKVEVKKEDDSKVISKVLKEYPTVQYSYNSSSNKLFLIGHVLTSVEKQELMHALETPGSHLQIEDNVVVDELVWQNMNALLSTNPNWDGVSVYSTSPGKFVVRGYLQNVQAYENLSDFLTLNFPYLDKLDNQVIVESNLQMAIQGILTQQGFSGVNFQINQGEVVLSGKIAENQSSSFEALQKRIRHLPGIRSVKNFVIQTTQESSRVDISSQYNVTGFSKSDNDQYYVVINGKIIGTGDNLDGMMVTEVTQKSVLLEKDGQKFSITYNLQ